MRTAAADGRGPRAVPPRAPASARMRRDARADRRGRAPRRRRSARRHALLRPRPTQQGLFDWYSRVAREFPSLPIVVYNVPIRTAVDIRPRPSAGSGAPTRTSSGSRRRRRTSSTSPTCSTSAARLHRALRDRAPLLPDAGARRRRAPELRRRTSPRSRAPRSTTPSSPGDHDGAPCAPLRPPSARGAGLRRDEPRPVKWTMERLGILASGGVRPPLASPQPASRDRIEAILAEVGLLEHSPAG